MTAHHHQSNILPLNDVIPLARSLARKEAHRPDDVDDLVQEGLFAYHKAEQRFLRCGTPVRKPWSLARCTMQRAIRGYYWQQCEWRDRGDLSKAVGLDQGGSASIELAATDALLLTAGLDGRSGASEQAELFELDDYFNALERTLGATARLIAENLLIPSGECAVRILCEVRDKQEQQAHFNKNKHRGHQPRGVKTRVRISPRLVREALGITPAEWAKNMACIRDFTRKWLKH